MQLVFQTAALISFSIGCTTAYYNFWETFGVEKRDLVKKQVSETSDSQIKAQEELQDTLEIIRRDYGSSGGELEDFYDDLSKQYESIKTRSNDLSKRIDRVEKLANDLFAEWETEAKQITNPNYRQDSLAKRRDAIATFKSMLTSMRSVEAHFQPILTKLNDQVLYLKHNLNAQAMGTFKKEFAGIDDEYNELEKLIQNSVAESKKFIGDLS